ncbi:hypothetical protein KPH14_006518 [Odynerus spinipes]|uniref:Uncharacterized protein n=1 Tax=Odynerus spinipes TaxID=1348599 RepID=A0AAD9VS49_9HYME|nr:hypothetical protein KPH14_006518 [Odynerus spinipes]
MLVSRTASAATADHVEPPPPANRAYRQRFALAASSELRRSVRYTEDYRENCRLAGGASDKRELSPAESTSSRDSHNVRREAGGGSPPVGCGRPCQTTRCRSPSMDRSSSSSWNPSSACRPSAPCRPSTNCQPCAPSPKSILKKRDCCQCVNGCCMCQPMPRNCNCPPPVQVDVRAERDCTCGCPSSPECACPPSERRFPKSMVKCPNARLCCPLPRLPPGPKCHCVQCQPCLPPPCDPCTSSICRPAFPAMNPCRSMSPCSLCSPCRPRSPDYPPASRAGRSTSPCCKTVQRYCNERSCSRDDTLNACTRASNGRPSSAITCGRRTGQSSSSRRRRAGGDDAHEERNATKRENEPTSTNDRDRASQSPFEADSIDDVCSSRYRETIAGEIERERKGGCSCKVDTLDCRRRIDSSDKIRSDGAFNHISPSSSISSFAYQCRNEPDPGIYDITRDYASDVGSGIDDNARHCLDRDNVHAFSNLHRVQDSSQCHCAPNEIGCDPSCDYCCSFGTAGIKEEPRCRCGPDENGCDKTCGYCCALSNSNGILAERNERCDILNLISGDDNRQS